MKLFTHHLNSLCAVSLNIGLRATTGLRRKPNNRLVKYIELTVYREANKLSESQAFIFRSNEARPHLLADIFTLDRQEEVVLVRG